MSAIVVDYWILQIRSNRVLGSIWYIAFFQLFTYYTFQILIFFFSLPSDPALGASALVPVSVQTSFITFCDQYSVALTTRLQKRYTAWRDAEREALITKLTKVTLTFLSSL
jgi:hypothetical protein